MARNLKPDIITMDILMPKVDGYAATKQIMSTHPIPIIIFSSLALEDELQCMSKALTNGALAAFPKFFDEAPEAREKQAQHLIELVRALSSVHVMRRRTKEELTHSRAVQNRSIDIVGLGLSTGGPQALTTIIKSLDNSFSVPIVAVLHISNGFIESLVKWMQKLTDLRVCLAHDGEELLPGTLYFAPDDCHLVIEHGARPKAKLDKSEPVGNFRPSITKLFESLAVAYPASSAGGILTGMGSDGAQGLLKMKNAKCFTFAQAGGTSVVSGMGDAARELGAVNEDIALEGIASFLKKIGQQRKG